MSTNPEISGAHIPWVRRTSEQWQQQVREEEAVRLFFLASQSKPLTKPDAWIDRWQLQIPLEAYWGGSVRRMLAAAGEVRKNDDSKFARDETDDLACSVADIFARQPDLYQFLDVTRQLLNPAEAPKEKWNFLLSKEYNLKEKRADALRQFPDWENLEVSYQTLTALFYPKVLSFAHRKARKMGADFDEWQSIAGIQLVQTALNFYWETVAIGPSWTTDRFLSVVCISIHNPMSLVYDTRTLELSTAGLENYPSADKAEEVVLNSLAEAEINRLILAVTPTTKDIEVLRLRIFAGMEAGEIAAELGMSFPSVKRAIGRFKTRLRDLDPSEVSIPIRPKREEHATPFWDDLFANLPKYRRCFDEYQDILKPSFREIVQLLFRLQTGQRDSTIAAIDLYLRSKGINLTKDSIRRRITMAINQLNHKEPLQQDGSSHYKSRWVIYQKIELIEQAYRNPHIWDSYSERTREILTKVILEGRGENGVAGAVAKELGIHACTVSRTIDRVLRDIFRTNGNPSLSPELLSKPRHLLPT